MQKWNLRKKTNKEQKCKLCGLYMNKLDKKRGFCGCIIPKFEGKKFIKLDDYQAYKDLYKRKIELLKASKKLKTKKVRHNKPLVSKSLRRAFLASQEWARLRYKTFQKYGKVCACCGYNDPKGQYHVDHIKPLSIHWHLRNNPNNLQVLCSVCSTGKSDTDETDWRNDFKANS